MSEENKMIVKPSAGELTIPIDLLQIFKNDVRIFPLKSNPRGYLIFDREMIISVLERGSDIERMELAKSLKDMDKTNSELVVMQR